MKHTVIIKLQSNDKKSTATWSVETHSQAKSHSQDAAGGLNKLNPKQAPWKCVEFSN